MMLLLFSVLEQLLGWCFHISSMKSKHLYEFVKRPLQMPFHCTFRCSIFSLLFYNSAKLQPRFVSEISQNASRAKLVHQKFDSFERNFITVIMVVKCAEHTHVNRFLGRTKVCWEKSKRTHGGWLCFPIEIFLLKYLELASIG